jgi:hypothetical protein
MKDDAELEEYFTLVKIVSEFDQRLLTVKSWGVALSLVGLGLGFQYRSYGMFLVAAASSIAFWSLEGAMKRHQMRHYPRLRDIEVNSCLRAPDRERHLSAPRIDWSWAMADKVLSGKPAEIDQVPQPRGLGKSYSLAWLLPHVWLPHAITFLIGALLFLLGYTGYLEGFELGTVKSAA